jgi:hypothetical protein
MLTQQQIAQLAALMQQQLEPINSAIADIKSSITALTHEQKRQVKLLRYLKKTLDILVKRSDEADTALQRRVRRIEDELRLSSIEPLS